jgi:hypothetical protein
MLLLLSKNICQKFRIILYYLIKENSNFCIFVTQKSLSLDHRIIKMNRGPAIIPAAVKQTASVMVSSCILTIQILFHLFS